MHKCPLAYVAIAHVAVKAHATDPTTEYENVDQDKTSRAPHDQYVYDADKKTLWHILHDTLKYHPSYTSIWYFASTHNSRAAYLALALHNLGKSQNHRVLKEAKENLNIVLYTEEKTKVYFRPLCQNTQIRP